MSLILRVDVDKPYGNHTFGRRILSKIIENYFPNFKIKSGYLSHLKEFITFCNNKKVVGTFYFRICTRPDSNCLQILQNGGHEIGLHLENSFSKFTFLEELNLFQLLSGRKVKSFSKHGSGVFKLGKYHYPKYEPEKYLEWATEGEVFYNSGNGIPKKPEDLISSDNYFDCVFWLEPSYRSISFNNISDLIEIAKNHDVVVLIHPCNYIADSNTKEAFHNLVKLSHEQNVQWKLFNDI